MDNIVLLCSGNLGLNAVQQVFERKQLCFVFTDKGSTSIIEYCTKNNILFYTGNPRKIEARPVIDKIKCDFLLSVNYLFIVNKDLLEVASKYAINIHGSLLPKYRGRTPHVWAIINGEKLTGITAHLMNEKVDEGKIVKQISLPIEEDDTGFSILQKFHSLYSGMIASVLDDLLLGQLNYTEQDHSKATYFSKRTPDDGEINWNWHKERIMNWVRAQTKPYPGAFTYYGNQRVIIYQIAFSDHGFYDTDENGLILQSEPELIIKTPNGAITLLKIESNTPLVFKKGNKLCPI